MASDPSTPLRSTSLGYDLRFTPGPDLHLYGLAVAQICVEALRRMAFSGRCEFYDTDDPGSNEYRVGLGLRHLHDPPSSDPHWWEAFVQAAADQCEAGKGVEIRRESCQFTRLRDMRQALLPGGAVAFERGLPVDVLADDECTFFVPACREAQGYTAAVSRAALSASRGRRR